MENRETTKTTSKTAKQRFSHVKSNKTKMITNKQHFIKQLFKALGEEKYIVLKHLDEKMEDDSSADLDLLIQEKDRSAIVTFTSENEVVERWIRKDTSSMTQLFIHFKDNSFLQLDLLLKLVRVELEYLDLETVFADRIKNESGFYTYSLSLLFEHVALFNVLNYSGIPRKYIAHFLAFPKEKQEALLEHFNHKYHTAVKTIAELEHYRPSLHEQLIQNLKTKPHNAWHKRIKHYAEYFYDKLSGVFQVGGRIITFSGVDGAGKSTMIELTKEILSNKYRKKVVVLRHRPSVLPIISAWRYGKKKAEQRATETLPHSGNNKGGIGSLMRFFYYYLDYLFGQFYVYTKYLMKGYIVLYDRYYFDFIIDGKRSNLQIPSGLSKALYRFVQKPALNFFLYADVGIIRARKKELPAKTIVKMTNKYRTLFDELNRSSPETTRYLSIENIQKEQTLKTILHHCKKVI